MATLMVLQTVINQTIKLIFFFGGIIYLQLLWYSSSICMCGLVDCVLFLIPC